MNVMLEHGAPPVGEWATAAPSVSRFGDDVLVIIERVTDEDRRRVREQAPDSGVFAEAGWSPLSWAELIAGREYLR